MPFACLDSTSGLRKGKNPLRQEGSWHKRVGKAGKAAPNRKRRATAAQLQLPLLFHRALFVGDRGGENSATPGLVARATAMSPAPIQRVRNRALLHEQRGLKLPTLRDSIVTVDVDGHRSPARAQFRLRVSRV